MRLVIVFGYQPLLNQFFRHAEEYLKNLEAWPMQTKRTKILSKPVPALDGLRGLAVLLVIGFHYVEFFSFGWSGVDLFFILSGFLITGKLVESFHNHRYYSVFYLKRILRIVPLYFLVLFIFFVLIPLFVPSLVTPSFKELLQQQIYYWSFSINFYEATHGWPDNITLVHFWSLACEMQFYLVWPFVIRLFFKRGRAIIVLLILLIAMALVFRQWGSLLFPMDPIYSYVLLFSRMDSFCAGALLYLLIADGSLVRHKKLILITAAITLCGIVAIAVAQHISWHYFDLFVRKYGYTMNALFWCCLMGYTLLEKQGWWHKVISHGIMTRFGRYSYGMYVFHLPALIILSKQKLFPGLTAEGSSWIIVAVAFIITCLASMISYHYMEIYFLKLKPARKNA